MGEGIGWAVKQLQNGARVRRAGWNGKGMWLALVRPADAVEAVIAEQLRYAPGTFPTLLEFVVMRTAPGPLVPWLCSQTDLLAMDWETAVTQPVPDANSGTPMRSLERGTGQAICCFIPDDQQEAARSNKPFTSCQRPAEWEITEAKAPGYPTLACEKHVGQLLGAGLHYVAPFEAAGTRPTPAALGVAEGGA